MRARLALLLALAVAGCGGTGAGGEPAPVPDRPLVEKPASSFRIDEGDDSVDSKYDDLTVDPLPALRSLGKQTPLVIEQSVRAGPYVVGAWPLVEAGSATGGPTAVHATRERHDGMAEIGEGWPWPELSRAAQGATRASLWIDPARSWIDATVELRAGGAATLALETALSGDLELRAIDAGAGSSWHRIGTWLLIERGSSSSPVRLRMTGEPAILGDRFGSHTASITHLIPVSPGSTPDFDVTIHVPSEFRVVAELPVEAAPAPVGWRAWRLRGSAPAVRAMVVSDTHTRQQQFTHAGVRWTVIGDDEQLADAVRSAADAVAALGPPPSPEAVVVQGEPGFVGVRVPGLPDVAPGPLIQVTWSGAGDRFDRHAAAAALAGWWLGDVPDPTHQPCSWRDAAAAHLGTWVLDDDDRHRLRERWAGFAAMATPYRLDTNGPASLSVRLDHCGRGALLWAGLEQRLGRDGVAALVRELGSGAAAQAGGGWAEVAAHLHGDDAAWLTGWIRRPLPPELGVDDVVLGESSVSGTLRLRAGLTKGFPPLPVGASSKAAFVPPFVGDVTVAAMAGTTEVGRTEVHLDEFRIDFTIAISAPATHVVIDPDTWLPLRITEPAPRVRTIRVTSR